MSTDQPTDWRATSRRWEDRAKTNRALVEDLREALAAANAEAATARAEAAAAQADLARYKVAAETGVPLHLLHGDEAECRRRADLILGWKADRP
jgi:hypothetical protein